MYTVALGYCYKTSDFNLNPKSFTEPASEKRRTFGSVCGTAYTFTDNGVCYSNVAKNGVATGVLSGGREPKSADTDKEKAARCSAPPGNWQNFWTLTIETQNIDKSLGTPVSQGCSVGKLRVISSGSVESVVIDISTEAALDPNYFLITKDLIIGTGKSAITVIKGDITAAKKEASCSSSSQYQVYTTKAACITKGTFTKCNNVEFKDAPSCKDSSHTWYGFGKQGPSGTTIIPLTTEFVEDFDTKCVVGSNEKCNKDERNLFGTIDINYGYYGESSCDTCQAGLSM